MTIRLSAMFEEHMGRLLYNWKCAKRRETNALKKTARGSGRKKKLKYVSLKDLDSESESGMNGKPAAEAPKPGPSTRLNGASPAKTSRKQLNNLHKGLSDSNNDDDCDDDDWDITYNPRTSRSRKYISNNEQENGSDGKNVTYNPRSRPRKRNVNHDDGDESNDDEEEGDDDGDKDYNPKTRRGGTKNIVNYVGDHNDTKDTTYNPRTRRRGGNTNNNDEEDGDEEYYDDDKDTTYNPRSGARKKTPSKRNCISSSLRSVNKSSDTSDSDSSSSDNDMLLEVQRKLLQQSKRNIVRKRIDSNDTSESDENIRTSTRTRMIKRPRYIEDSNSEISDVGQRQNDDDTEDGSPCISISSRGRVRKITERARALFNRR